MNSKEILTAYVEAQKSIHGLKVAVLEILRLSYPNGMKNSEIGKVLGIYMGHIGHEGHIPRTILEILKSEGLVNQDDGTKEWFLSLPEKLKSK